MDIVNNENSIVSKEKRSITDIFLWANRIDEIKKDISVELFLFNKNYTPFYVNFSDSIASQIRPIFLFDMINYINMGAGTGLFVKDFELSEGEKNVLLRADLPKVGRAETLLHLIKTERKDIEEFSDQDHDLKKIKGVVARFSYQEKDKSEKEFFIIKALQQSSIIKGDLSWEFDGGRFSTFSAEAGVKMPIDNQVLIIDSDIFVFNQSKFENLFQYNFKKLKIADEKIAEIEKKYRLSFPDEVTLESLVKNKKTLFNKLQKIEIGDIEQAQAIEYADEMQLDLMTDDDGSIIIMDERDLDTFISLINEDYVLSGITGKRYKIKSKKILDEPEGEPPRGVNG